ncbi:hypothetical protein AB71_2945 [Escherichia coli 1-182-04_S1_C3]|nr:hypothetical protein AB71_2945 [Escherichia coli 1-182-04_S1_C3]
MRFLTEWLSKRCVNIIDMYQICFVTRQCLVNINKKTQRYGWASLDGWFCS